MDSESKVVKIIKGKDKTVASTVGEDLGVESIEQRGIIKGDIYTASSKAREILQKAQQEAEEIIRKACEEREKERKGGYQQGYEEGLAQVTEMLAKARVEYDQILKSSQHDVLNLAFKIAEKIIGKQLQMDQNLIMDIVAQALQAVRQSRQITIRVNPEDAKILKANREGFVQALGTGRVVDFVEDKKIERGGCIIESEIGIVEAQLQTQLDRLRKVLSSEKKQ